MEDRKIKPLSCENGQRPGSYRLVSRAGASNLNKGEMLSFDQFITGYGHASGLKIAYYFSSDVFNLEKSYYTYKLGQDPHSGMPTWGDSKNPISQVGTSITLGTHKDLNTWEYDSYFFNVNMDGHSLAINTEVELGDHPPFSYRLVVDKTADAGNHSILFVLTYFDGEKWNNTEERVNFKINNAFEKHSTILSLLAAIALLTSIGNDGLIPLINHYFPTAIDSTENFINSISASASSGAIWLLSKFSYLPI